MSKCEGCCDEYGGHEGEVVRVHVVDEGKHDWGEFDYCETAIAEDVKRGLKVDIVSPPQLRNE